MKLPKLTLNERAVVLSMMAPHPVKGLVNRGLSKLLKAHDQAHDHIDDFLPADEFAVVTEKFGEDVSLRLPKKFRGEENYQIPPLAMALAACGMRIMVDEAFREQMLAWVEEQQEAHLPDKQN
jgi:hypothetical protein